MVVPCFIGRTIVLIREGIVKEKRGEVKRECTGEIMEDAVGEESDVCKLRASVCGTGTARRCNKCCTEEAVSEVWEE
jgi:hypothetical protein